MDCYDGLLRWIFTMDCTMDCYDGILRWIATKDKVLKAEVKYPIHRLAVI